GDAAEVPDLAMPNNGVAIVSTSPADGDKHVSVLVAPTITLSGPFDPASVTTLDVQLLAPHATVPVQAQVSGDANTLRITLQPAAPLDYAGLHRLRISSLKAADGSPIPDLTVQFTTAYNQETDDESYDNATGTTLTD